MQPEPITLVDLLRRRAGQTPNQCGYEYLSDGETHSARVTYAELDRQARAIGSWLQSRGASGERALLLYPPGLDYIAAFFGCLYAGVIAVPAYPPQRKRGLPRVQSILKDSQAKYALTTVQNREAVERLSRREAGYRDLATLVWLNTDTEVSGAEDDWHQPDITANTLTFLQYTSGSTGRPKGVKISHCNLLHNQRMIQQAFGHTEQTVVVGWLPLYHDMGLIGNVLQPLFLGVSCILMSPSHFLQKPRRWLSTISRYRATTSGGPNFAYDLCIRAIPPEQRESLDLSCWSIAFNGAEPIHASTLDRFVEAFKDCGFRREAFYPCYGLAEATLLVAGGYPAASPVLRTVQKTALEQHRAIETTAQEGAQRLVSCGQTRLDQRIVIVDPESLTIRPTGQVGEIWVKGSSVAQGYWQRPEETAQVFEAYLAETGEGPFLRTGDLGFVHDGELFVTGRLKDLIIIRGRNHYPHDIEQTVEESHPFLRSGGAAAFAVSKDEEEQLVVVQEVEARPGVLDTDTIISVIRQSVAEQHDVQVYAVVLIKPGTLPKTSSGKVQRSLCHAKFLANELNVVGQSVLQAASFVTESKTQTDQTKLVAQGDIEWKVAEIWSQVLGRPDVGPQDNFFALGGDSLRGMQTLSRLREVCQADVPLEILFQYPTVEEFAAEVERMQRSASIEQYCPLQPMAREGELPLSFSQERFWFLDQLSPGSPFNNIPIVLRLKGRLDIPALHCAFGEIVRRHEILRASFILINGQPAQRIAPELALPLPIEDLIGIPEQDREERLQHLVLEEARRPFDLANGPLLRHRLFRLSEKDHAFSLTIHHIVADGLSMGILSRELTVLYNAFRAGQTSPLPALPLQYIDTVLHQRQDTHGQEWEQQVSYWRQQLDHVPYTLSLPFDYSRPDVQGHQGARHSWTVPAKVVQQLRARGRCHRATLFMTLLAAFEILLYRYSGQSDFCIGTPVANRARPECEDLIGCFVNTVALRADLSGDPSFPELLARVREAVLGARANQEIPFERLVDELEVPRDLSHTPLFQVMLILEDGPPDVCQLDGLQVNRMKVATQTSVFDLTLEIARAANGGLDAVFEYSTDLFAGHTITRMADHFQVLLNNLVENPESRVSELALLTKKERRYVLVDCNETEAYYPRELCLHQLFEAQTKQTPDAVALVWNGRPYTYAFVNERANQLARYLQGEGLPLEAPVGLCVDRSPEMVVGLLGSLKAGVTYVPIDPAYPKERQAFILKDVGARFVLTQERFVMGLRNQTIPVLSLDEDCAVVGRLPGGNLPVLTSPDNLAYILYTSGTTGQPKGTGISHRALVNHCTAMVEQYQLSSNDRVLQFASVSFDVAAEECFPTWLAGATVVLRPNEPVPAFSDFQDFISEHSLTVLNLPTPYWTQWIEDMERTGAKLPSSLRLVIVGSEKALPDFLIRWQQLAGDRVTWCNSYGPTEATITASSYVPDVDMDWSALSTVPIGRPIANVQMYVLDRSLQPVPIGIPGELYIGGVGLARGYHNLPEPTAETFIPDPFASESGQRLYCTGDRVRRRADGNLEFLGRRDEQVKIRGFRVELPEIEFCLRQHPQVTDVRVFLESSPPDEWSALMGRLTAAEQDSVLRDIESLTAVEAQWIYDLEANVEERRKTVIQKKPEFDLYLKINKEEFLSPPRANQRNWLLRRALDELSDDLRELDAISKRFVSGSDRANIGRAWSSSRAEYTPSELIIEGQQVMQDWEAPLMKAMADIATESRGDVLEVGFGMGISASFIQERSPRSHTVIECNQDVMSAFAKWRSKYPDRDIRLIQGRWQDAVDALPEFDGVLFDTYPVTEEEFEDSVINSITFAQAFIPAAARLLRPGGVFTYYTNEIDSFSRRHQRLLFRHFRSFTLSVVHPVHPPDNCHYWWADSMVIVKAVK